MPVAISVRTNVKAFAKELDIVARRQLPYATALALTGIANRVKSAEVKNLSERLDRPTPFTLGSIGVKGATKANLTALVFMRDIAATYLDPFEFGGVHALGRKQGLLTPKGIGVNQYGNIPRNRLRQLKGRRDVFIGRIVTKSGAAIDGVWQRPGPRGGKRGKATGLKQTPLKLLIRFTDPQTVKQHLDYRARAAKTVALWFKPEMSAAIRRAIRTSR